MSEKPAQAATPAAMMLAAETAMAAHGAPTVAVMVVVVVS
jgi:hypothetical protein